MCPFVSTGLYILPPLSNQISDFRPKWEYPYSRFIKAPWNFMQMLSRNWNCSLIGLIRFGNALLASSEVNSLSELAIANALYDINNNNNFLKVGKIFLCIFIKKFEFNMGYFHLYYEWQHQIFCSYSKPRFEYHFGQNSLKFRIEDVPHPSSYSDG